MLKSRVSWQDSYNQGYGLPRYHIQLWELDREGGRTQMNRCLRTVVPEKTPESPLDSKEIKPDNLKGNQPWILIGRIDAEAEAPVFWSPDVNRQLMLKTLMLGKTEGRRRREHQRMSWMDGITDTGTWFGQTPGDGEEQRGLACCSPWDCTELDTTGQLNNKNYKYAQNLSQCLLHDKCSINTTWVLHERNLKHQWGMVGKYLSEQNKTKQKIS